tara:strand:- start:79 stop:735 length:657 start_codon:yes stop_codon:yes gene_type:complete
MKIFVINLDSAKDRWEQYKDDDRYTRWPATHYDDLAVTHPIFDEMVSMWNIDPKEHRAKCACYISHTSLWKYIVKNKIDDVLILEDDAELVGELPDSSKLPQDGFCYLGGFTSNIRLTQGPLKINFQPPEGTSGIYEIDYSKYRMLMMLAIYIPKWEIAYKMLQAVEERGRPRAIDTMVKDTHRKQYLLYPAPFIEKEYPSQIRKNKKKHSNEFYEWV